MAREQKQAKVGMEVELGDETYLIEPQRLGRLERHLRKIFEVFGVAGSPAENIDNVDPGTLYDVLKVFIPPLMPEWQFRGFPTEDAFVRVQAGEAQPGDLDDDERDRSPTPPQLIEAVETIYRVNGGDRLARFFGKFVQPDVLNRTISAALADWAAIQSRKSLPSGEPGSPSDPSSSLPSENGALESTPSGTRVPMQGPGAPAPDLPESG